MTFPAWNEKRGIGADWRAIEGPRGSGTLQLISGYLRIPEAKEITKLPEF